MSDLKFEIILVYYKRPEMVLNALKSIKNLDYDNWHLTFIDDSGDNSFESTLTNYGFPIEKFSYVPIMMSDEQKVQLGGSIFGKYINDSIKSTDSDIIILLCDDDALFPDYLSNLNKFYNENKKEIWTYSHVKFFNPEKQIYEEAVEIPENKTLNTYNLNHTERIFPSCKVDSSQVTFRKEAFTLSNLWFAYPRTKDLDRDIFEKFSYFWGSCPFSGFYGQYKGWFENQLGHRHKIGKTYLK